MVALGGTVWWLSKLQETLVLLAAAAWAVGGILMIVNAFVTRMELSPDGFVLTGLWRRAWSWSDVERFYVHEARGVDLVGYVPTVEYKSNHVMARLVAALNLGTYAVPRIGLDAFHQAELMNRWLQSHRGR